MLSRLEADDPRIVVHTNPENLGFVRSVNIGLAHCPSGRKGRPSGQLGHRHFSGNAWRIGRVAGRTRRSALSVLGQTTLPSVRFRTFEGAGSRRRRKLTRTGIHQQNSPALSFQPDLRGLLYVYVTHGFDEPWRPTRRFRSRLRGGKRPRHASFEGRNPRRDRQPCIRVSRRRRFVFSDRRSISRFTSHREP